VLGSFSEINHFADASLMTAVIATEIPANRCEMEHHRKIVCLMR
jgi:hypothetical protein